METFLIETFALETVFAVDTDGAVAIIRVMVSTEKTKRLYRLIGEKVRERRDVVQLTQEELAQRVGFVRTSITNVEKGRQRISLHQLLLIAEAMDTDLRELLPSRSELAMEPRVLIDLDGGQASAPPTTANLIERLLAENDGPKHDQSRTSDT